MTGKSACVLMAAGGTYEGERKAMEHAASLTDTQLRFMGFSDVEVVMAAGVNVGQTDAIVAEARKQAAATARKWNVQDEEDRKLRASARNQAA
jgi:FMN-dependent NADH-azoreductase